MPQAHSTPSFAPDGRTVSAAGADGLVLTWETAKAIGLPIEMLEYNVDVETAGGHTKAARLTLDRLAVGKLVEPRRLPVHRCQFLVAAHQFLRLPVGAAAVEAMWA